jgi:hypothetical protein
LGKTLPDAAHLLFLILVVFKSTAGGVCRNASEFFTTIVQFQVPVNQPLATKSQINSPAPRMFARIGDEFRLVAITAADARSMSASTCVLTPGDQSRDFFTIQPASPVKNGWSHRGSDAPRHGAARA